MLAFYFLLAFIAGIAVAMQGVTNNGLRHEIGFGAMLVVNTAIVLVGAIAVALVDGSWSRLNGRVFAVPTVLLLGGVYGLTMVTIAPIVLARLGATTALSLVVLGQLACALALDHTGAFAIPRAAISPTRVVGVMLVVAGVALTRWR
ncbi:MAG: DMT family transporter [Planctomycetota bacterium]